MQQKRPSVLYQASEIYFHPVVLIQGQKVIAHAPEGWKSEHLDNVDIEVEAERKNREIPTRTKPFMPEGSRVEVCSFSSI